MEEEEEKGGSFKFGCLFYILFQSAYTGFLIADEEIAGLFSGAIVGLLICYLIIIISR